MNIKAILFDLDGTLLPMQQESFVKAYFGSLAKHLAEFGYKPEQLINSIWAGTKAMVKNNGILTNEQVFWNSMAEIYGDKVKNDIPKFDEYYVKYFDSVKQVCGFDNDAKKVVDIVRGKGIKVALATNPIFPKIATEKRIAWAGLKPEDFEFYTTYENCNHCKPNVEYYKDILNKLNIAPENCLMVGNDVSEDMIASEIGINCFLLTDCLINKENKNINNLPKGNFKDLINYLENNI